MRARTEHVAKTGGGACAAEISVAVLGGAWKPSILTLLHERGVLRFGELGRELGGPTPKVLTRQLRELEEDELVIRTVFAQVPPKVEYSLSVVGRDAMPLVDELARWGAAYASPQRQGERCGRTPSNSEKK